MKKILIIRLSSIGDIVLTSPIIRCLKNQTGACIHYLVKPEFKQLLEYSPYIDKLHLLNKRLKSTIDEIKKENFDYLIDLHNNIRTVIIKKSIRIKSYTYCKQSFRRFIHLNFSSKIKLNHVVNNYFLALNSLNVKNDNRGLDYFFSNERIYLDVEHKYICWSVGASHQNKMLSLETIICICDEIHLPIYLIGGEKETEMGEKIVLQTKNKHVENFCGKTDLNLSAKIIDKCTLLLTNDTGMMHIGAALKKKIISFWGCTKPSQGFSPYLDSPESVEIIYSPYSRPCSKQGKSCKNSVNGCVKKIKTDKIVKVIKKVLKIS